MGHDQPQLAPPATGTARECGGRGVGWLRVFKVPPVSATEGEAEEEEGLGKGKP